MLKREAVGVVAKATQTYDWRDTALYALSVGAGVDDLRYLNDKPAPDVLPTYGVIPAFDPAFEVLRATEADLVQLLHTAQTTELVNPFPSAGEMTTTATLRGLWDMKIGATAIVDTETHVDGTLCARTSWELLLRGEGGFGGERPPKRLRIRLPKDPVKRFEAQVATAPTQALLYRLTGDVNQIHASPEVAREAGFDRPILHGLCTYGIAGRVAIGALADGDPDRFVSLEARFSKVVMPGDTLVVSGFELPEPGLAAITATVEGQSEPALMARLTYRT